MTPQGSLYMYKYRCTYTLCLPHLDGLHPRPRSPVPIQGIRSMAGHIRLGPHHIYGYLIYYRARARHGCPPNTGTAAVAPPEELRTPATPFRSKESSTGGAWVGGWVDCVDQRMHRGSKPARPCSHQARTGPTGGARRRRAATTAAAEVAAQTTNPPRRRRGTRAHTHTHTQCA